MDVLVHRLQDREGVRVQQLKSVHLLTHLRRCSLLARGWARLRDRFQTDALWRVQGDVSWQRLWIQFWICQLRVVLGALGRPGLQVFLAVLDQTFRFNHVQRSRNYFTRYVFIDKTEHFASRFHAEESPNLWMRHFKIVSTITSGDEATLALPCLLTRCLAQLDSAGHRLGPWLP